MLPRRACRTGYGLYFYTRAPFFGRRARWTSGKTASGGQRKIRCGFFLRSAAIDRPGAAVCTRQPCSQRFGRHLPCFHSGRAIAFPLVLSPTFAAGDCSLLRQPPATQPPARDHYPRRLIDPDQFLPPQRYIRGVFLSARSDASRTGLMIRGALRASCARRYHFNTSAKTIPSADPRCWWSISADGRPTVSQSGCCPARWR